MNDHFQIKHLEIYSEKAWKMLFLAKHNIHHCRINTFNKDACCSALSIAEDGEVVFSSMTTSWCMHSYTDNVLKAKTGQLAKDAILDYIYSFDEPNPAFFVDNFDKINKTCDIEIDHCTESVEKTLKRIFFTFKSAEKFFICPQSYYIFWNSFYKLFSIEDINNIRDAINANDYNKALRLYFNNDMPKVRDYFILYDLLSGNSKKNMCKNYGNEAVDVLVGAPLNPFTMCQQKAMEDLLVQLQNDYERERVEIVRKQEEETKKLAENFDQVQNDLRRQFAEKKEEVIRNFKAMGV